MFNIDRNVRLWNMMYNLFVVLNCKITDTERKCIMRKHGQNHVWQHGTPCQKKVSRKQKKYSIMGATNKKESLSKCSEKLEKARLVELCIKQFNRKIREGPNFICTVCYWILYKKSVITYMYINKKYPCQKYFNIQQSFDGKHYTVYAEHVIQRA